MPLEVCHIAQSAGGVERYIVSLLEAADPEIRHSVICTDNGTLAATARAAGATVIVVNMVREINPRRDARALASILGVLRRLQPQLIHAHSGKGGALGRIAAWALRIPVVFTPHAFSYLAMEGFNKHLVLGFERLLARFPSVLLASSPSEASRAVREVWWPECRVVQDFPNSIVISDDEVQHRDRNQLAVLAVGRLCRQKNPEMFVRVATSVTRLVPNVRFTILGAGYGEDSSEEVRKAVAAHSLGDAFRILSWSAPEAVGEEMLKSDVFVSTSRYESFGYTTAEAMEKSLPVVGTRIDGTVDLVRHGETGFLVGVDEDDEMVAHVCALLRDPALRRQCGVAGRERIRREFSLEKNLPVLYRVYREVAGGA